jgi:hypothetical protein
LFTKNIREPLGKWIDDDDSKRFLSHGGHSTC